MDSNEFQIAVLERLAAIETTLKQMDYKSIVDKVIEEDKKITQLEDKVQTHSEKISKMEANGSWLWKTVGATLLAALLGLIIK